MTKAKTKDTNEYGLDLKGQMILEEYRELLPVFSRLKSLVLEKLGECLQRAGLIVSSLDARVKQEASLAGKLELKGQKYKSIDDITDIVGPASLPSIATRSTRSPPWWTALSRWTGTIRWTSASCWGKTPSAICRCTISAGFPNRCTRIPSVPS